MTNNSFISKVVKDLLDDEFSVYLIQDKMKDGCGGWFDSDKKQFLCCMGNNLGFEILIHEYCHYLQWKHRREFYDNLSKSTSKLFSWLDDKKITIKDNKLDKLIDDAIELEYDCEKLALKTIKKYKLDVNIDRYIRAASAYLHFYHYVKQHRSWTTNTSPYNDKLLKLSSCEFKALQFYQDASNITPKQHLEYNKIFV